MARGAARPAHTVTCSTFQLVPGGAALHHWLTEGGAPRAQPLASRWVKLRGIMNTPGLLWDQAEDGAFPEITRVPGFSLSLFCLSMPLLVSPGSTFLRNHLPGNPQVRLCFWDLYPHERAMLPDHRLTNCLLWAKFGPPPVSKVLLESSHTYSFMYYLWLLYGRMAELSSFDMHCLSCKATDVYYLVQ